MNEQFEQFWKDVLSQFAGAMRLDMNAVKRLCGLAYSQARAATLIETAAHINSVVPGAVDIKQFSKGLN